MKEDYEHARVAAFFDEFGEGEWARFEDGRTPPQSLAVHLDALHRFVAPGDRVLDVGAGPGRFTIELDGRTVKTPATRTQPKQFPIGIEYVIVNGKVVVDKGQHTGVMAGRALRRRWAGASWTTRGLTSPTR